MAFRSAGKFPRAWSLLALTMAMALTLVASIALPVAAQDSPLAVVAQDDPPDGSYEGRFGQPFSLPPFVHGEDFTDEQLLELQAKGDAAMALAESPHAGYEQSVAFEAAFSGHSGYLGRLSGEPLSAGIVALYAPEVPAEARSVVEAALADYAKTIAFNPSGRVEISVSWDPDLLPAGIGGSQFIHARGSGYWPATLADAVMGGDHTPGEADGFISLDASMDWYYGTDHNPPAEQSDLYSVVAHELGHAFGIGASVGQQSNGSPLLSGATERFTNNLIYQGLRLADMGGAQQAAAILSGEVYFDLGGEQQVKMYAPAQGWFGTLSHTADRTNEGEEFAGILMAPSIVNGSGRRIDGAILGMLAATGWPTHHGAALPVDLGAEVTANGTAVRFQADLKGGGLPANSYRIELIQDRVITATTVVPAGRAIADLPIALRGQDAIRFIPIDRFGQSFRSASYAPSGRTIAAAVTVEEIAASADFLEGHADVLRLYFAFFDRNPDIAGARYWIQDIYDTGSSLELIAQSFGNSQEFLNAYGSPTNSEFLTILYLNVLGRSYDQAGFVYWLDTLHGTDLSGGNPDGAVITRGQVVRWVTASTEFRAAHPY